MTINLSGIVILAGGESSRMGSPKALLKVPSISNMGLTIHHDKLVSLLEFHVQETFSAKSPVLIADNGKNFLNNECYLTNSFIKAIPDYIPNAGALSAITSAMQYLIQHEQNISLNSYVLVLSCDSLVNALSLSQIFIHQSKKQQAYYLKDDKQKAYPLLGAYRLDLLPLLEAYLESGERKVMKFLMSIDSKALPMPKEWHNLANFNNKNEFELALQYL